MALPVRQQVTYWGATMLGMVFILWILGDVILPFVLGGAIAYCLDPIADRLERLGLSRALSVTVITLLGLFIFVLLVLLIIPTIIMQAGDLITAAPSYLTQLRDWLIQRYPDLMVENSAIRQQLSNLASFIQSQGGKVLSTVLASFSGVLNIVVLFLIVPVVAIYLLVDWDNMVARVDQLLPRDHAPTIRRLAGEIDAALASFIRGQGTVCLILGVFYAAALMLAGLNFGVVIGAVAGMLTFIPYVGALIGGGLSIGVAIFQTWGETTADGAGASINWWYVAAIWAIFQVGQFVEGNILTPRLVGNSVGLHPVWLLFALSGFGTLFGFVGLLVAVPLAAAVGVLVRFTVEQYQDSPLYRGRTLDD